MDFKTTLLLSGCFLTCLGAHAQESPQFSGIYPHLASFNRQSECGTGAVVPWAGRLWWVTYAPHQPQGSDDKLVSMNEQFEMTIHPESIGGTPANRMIHDESRQLFIGPYVIDSSAKIRVIDYKTMYGRPTANARHLTDPAGKIYSATMEEGLYEIDVDSLKVTELWRDEQKKNGRQANLPGYHGKGMYSGFGRLIYANNGEHGEAAQRKPDVPSGCLASWDGKADQWTIVSRRQFTEVTGPGGIHGNAQPDSDPIWTIGWDHRSLILMCLGREGWSEYRLPKASHTYDGAHGWNTEWPRIREIGEQDCLMTMHGMFWRFPKTFSASQSAGLRPRSTYLKVIGDFCRYGDRIVCGCDDAAKAEFLNTRKAKGKVAGPAESQSNLWFITPDKLDTCGPALGRGAVWLDDAVDTNKPSVPFLFAGFEHRGVHLTHDAGTAVEFLFEVDAKGDGQWSELQRVEVPASGYYFHTFERLAKGEWIRVRSSDTCRSTAWFEMRSRDLRSPTQSKSATTQALAMTTDKEIRGGLLRAGDREAGLQIVTAIESELPPKEASAYRLTPELKLVAGDAAQRDWMFENVALVPNVLQIEGDSVLYVDDDGQRYRLPIGNADFRRHPELLNRQRISRETTTERDLFQCAGTFYELPARNAGGFAKLRPIATHPYFIQDYCSWRGLLALTGIRANAADDEHLISSADGRAAVWLGAVDDLWGFGKPTGSGGPWTNASVRRGTTSDPFLMSGFDQKRLEVRHQSPGPLSIDVQVDITGTGRWVTYARLDVPAKTGTTHQFDPSFAAYWIRFVANQDATVTAHLVYE